MPNILVRFSFPPAPMKYKQIKQTKTFNPNYFICLKRTKNEKKLKIVGAIFLAGIFAKKTTTKTIWFYLETKYSSFIDFDILISRY